MARKAKGERPVFFNDPQIDRLLAPESYEQAVRTVRS